MSSSEKTQSLLNIIRQADNFPNFSTGYPERHPINGKRLIPLYLSQKDFQNKIEPIGILPAIFINEIKNEKGLKILSIMKKLNEKEKSEKRKIKEEQKKSKNSNEDKSKQQNEITKGKEKEKEKRKEDYKITVLAIYFSDEVNAKGVEGRTEVMARLVDRWKNEKKFGYALKAWTGEKISIYASTRSLFWQKDKELKNKARKPFGNVAFEIERAAAPIFGFTTLGVDLIGTCLCFQRIDSEYGLMYRIVTAYQDEGDKFGTVSGAIAAGKTPLDAVIVAAREEAGWAEELIKSNAKTAGLISLFQISKWGGLLPCDYVYDLKLPSEDPQTPKKVGEDNAFQLLSISELFSALENNEFTPNSSAIIIDFLIRHGHITAENEPNYLEIIRRLHRRTGIAGPGH
uniref:Nudix hydrolase domain-containing protein n=1 Tax=Kwoniella pini CBS 10737 TaxID=1296096 RepID=A0A1B9ICC6_9TREE|nr:uncharacterized protein I206_00342 [Kwoniella pini CBS 10737]OCF53041.1 hypothetical protein I206_00342 [Kwoniella pini CBS 10737]